MGSTIEFFLQIWQNLNKIKYLLISSLTNYPKKNLVLLDLVCSFIKIAENMSSTSNDIVDMKSDHVMLKINSIQNSSTKWKISTSIHTNATSSKKHKKERKCQSEPGMNKSTAKASKVLSKVEKIFIFLSFEK